MASGYSNFKLTIEDWLFSSRRPSFILEAKTGPIPFTLKVPEDIASISLVIVGYVSAMESAFPDEIPGKQHSCCLYTSFPETFFFLI